MVEPSTNKKLGKDSTRGLGNLVEYQNIKMGIVRQDTLPPGTPKDPHHPLDLITVPKTIATAYKTYSMVGRVSIPLPNPPTMLKSLTDEKNNPTSTIVWYVATIENALGDRDLSETFFRHDIFTVDPKTKKAELETVRSKIQGLAMTMTWYDTQDKKPSLLAQIDEVLRDDNWLADGKFDWLTKTEKLYLVAFLKSLLYL